MLQSASTHMPPTGHELAGADPLGDPGEQLGIALLDPGEVLGGGADEAVLGVVLHQGRAVAKVRAHLRMVSRSGQSHAVSMWAWPTAVTRAGSSVPSVLPSARRRRTGRQRRLSDRRGGRDVGRIEGGAGGDQGGMSLPGHGGARRQVDGQADGQAEVAGQGLHRRPADGQLGAAEDEPGGPSGSGRSSGQSKPAIRSSGVVGLAAAST